MTDETSNETPVEAAAAAPEPEAATPAPVVEAEAPAPLVEKPAERGSRPDKRPERRDEKRDRNRDRDRKPQQAGGNSNPNNRDRDRDRDRDRRPDRRPDGPIEIEYDKLVADSLYLDNQAHLIVARLRDLDTGTRSQLRRLYGAVRRACRAMEGDRQHQFVMLRARLAYTIARHSLRSLDPVEKLLLQVTRKNESRGYDRFRDLFEAIIAYNE
ncbi:MAG: type III-A CRISPR-associated protein Csm2 [Acidobacteria bacterium]|nr:type III-A CRISPR-associated protein Csm2 [Acidobacteriota bacterium]